MTKPVDPTQPQQPGPYPPQPGQYPQQGYPGQYPPPYQQQPIQQPITANQLGRGAVWLFIIIPGIAILIPLVCCGIAAIGGEIT